MPQSIKILYKHRYLWGVGAAIIALYTKGSTEPPYLIITLIGLVLRFWAVGYLGTDKGAVRPEKIITAGPYQFVRHPLYIGNGLIVIGLLLFFSNPIFVILLITMGYILIYSIFAFYEERLLMMTFDHYFPYRLKVGSIIPISRYDKTEGHFLVNNLLSDSPATVAVIILIAISYIR